MKDLTDIKDRLDKQRKTRPLEPVRGPARLLLFPLCDSRGLVSQSLGYGEQSAGAGSKAEPLENREAESIFFAWLLELPTGMDAGEAARAVLLVCGVVPGARTRLKSVPNTNAAKDNVFKTAEAANTVVVAKINEDRLRFRKTMIGLLRRVGSRGSLYQPPEKIPDLRPR